ncbi:hypothetical protein ACHAPT_013248 [Fusarium lateritium]
MVYSTLQYNSPADRDHLTGSFTELWDILVSAAKDPTAGEIVCILDALDECESHERARLCQALAALYSSNPTSNLKILLTTRPYGGIIQHFKASSDQIPIIHLSGEEDEDVMGQISREIDLFIQARVKDIGTRMELPQEDQDLLLSRLTDRPDNTEAPTRTYLWVHLTLDLIMDNNYLDKARILDVTSRLPRTVDEAYDGILANSQDANEAMKLLHIVVAATRPLTVNELNLALSLRPRHRAYADLDLKVGPEAEKRFRRKLRNLCGLFITVYDSKIYLLHQTAKEFLVADLQDDTAAAQMPTTLRWKHSLHPQHSDGILSEICMLLLLFPEFAFCLSSEVSQYTERYVFLDYAAKNWAYHLRKSRIPLEEVKEAVLKICAVEKSGHRIWLNIYWTSKSRAIPGNMTSVIIASYFGLTEVVAHFLDKGETNINEKDTSYQRSALSWAAENGFDTTVLLLLRRGYRAGNWFLRGINGLFRERIQVDSPDDFNRTPLLYAALNGHVAVVKLLLATGKANPDWRDSNGVSPLWYAKNSGHEEVVEILSAASRKRKLSELDLGSREPLLNAIRTGDMLIVKPLLDAGKVDLNVLGESGQTPLSVACSSRNARVVTLLLDSQKVDVNRRDVSRQTPVLVAAAKQYWDIVWLLFNTGALDLNLAGRSSRGLISFAAQYGQHDLVAALAADTIT